MKVLSYIENSVWAILPSAYDKMHLIATRHSNEIDRLLDEPKPESLLTKRGESMVGTRYAENREGVAVLDVNGVIAKRMNLFADLCEGGTSTELLAKDFQTALEAPEIKAIVFNIHSPGGDAFGMNEIANLIYQARGKKPIKAYVNGMGCSAAYFIAAACDEIICDAQAMLGSIGVVSESQDPTEFYKKLGIDRKVVTSSHAPKKRLDLNTDEGMTDFVATLDAMEKVFISRVGKFRGKSFDEVVSDFNRGGVLIGKDAVKAGMADRIGSLEGVIAELKKKPRKIGDKNMSFMESFKAWLNSDEVKAELEDAAPTAEATLLAEKQAAEHRASIAEQEKQELIKQQREAAVSGFAEKATSYTAEQVKTGRLTPAEEKDFSAAYLQALTDDFNSPLETGSRVGRIEAAQAARTPHIFDKEVVGADETAKILGNSEGVSEERKQELLNATPLGQSSLKLVAKK
jgi:signal peptide peptidase SppA